jgi:hypothetical protein
MGEWVYRPRFLDLATSWRWSASRPGRFTSRERAAGTHWIGGLVGPRASLDDIKRKSFTLPGLELRPLSRKPLASRYTVPKLLIRERYYVLFLIPLFIVQLAKFFLLT